jgi:hypothetical protein
VGDSGEEVALWLLTSLCTSAKREVEVARIKKQYYGSVLGENNVGIVSFHLFGV